MKYKRKAAIKYLWIFAMCVFASVSLSVEAAETAYRIPKLGVEIHFPEKYYVVTEDTAEDDAIFGAIGTTKSEIMELFESSNIYLNAINLNDSTEIVVFMQEIMMDDLSILDDLILNDLANTLVDGYESNGIKVLDYEIYQHSQVKFFKILFTDEAETVHGLQFYTIRDNQALNFTFRSYQGEITSEQEAEMIKIVDNIRFLDENTETFDGKTEEIGDVSINEGIQNSHVYVDQEGGVTFTIPENWKKEAFSDTQEFLDAKFVDENSSSGILYGSVDYFAVMSEEGYSTETLELVDEDFLTKSDIASMYGVTEDQVTEVTYSGTQYYQVEVEETTTVLDVEISAQLINLFCLKNGWLYTFQYYGYHDAQTYHDFECLLESVEYDLEKDDENNTGHVNEDEDMEQSDEQVNIGTDLNQMNSYESQNKNSDDSALGQGLIKGLITGIIFAVIGGGVSFVIKKLKK